MLERLPPQATLVPVQALGELFAVLVRKAKRSRREASASPIARARAARLLGNVTMSREDARAVWIAPWLESLRAEAEAAVRRRTTAGLG